MLYDSTSSTPIIGLHCLINSFVVVGVCISLHVSRPSLYHLSFLEISYAILSYAIPALSYAPPFSLTPSLLSLTPLSSLLHPSLTLIPPLLRLPCPLLRPSLFSYALLITPRPSSLTHSLPSLTPFPPLLRLPCPLLRPSLLSDALLLRPPLLSYAIPCPLLRPSLFSYALLPFSLTPSLPSPTPLAFSLTPLSYSSPCSPTPLLLRLCSCTSSSGWRSIGRARLSGCAATSTWPAAPRCPIMSRRQREFLGRRDVKRRRRARAGTSGCQNCVAERGLPGPSRGKWLIPRL